MEAPDRLPVSPKVAVRRIDPATAEEVQVVRVVAIRRHRPIVAVAANKVQGPVAGEEITGLRIPDGTGRT